GPAPQSPCGLQTAVTLAALDKDLHVGLCGDEHGEGGPDHMWALRQYDAERRVVCHRSWLGCLLGRHGQAGLRHSKGRNRDDRGEPEGDGYVGCLATGLNVQLAVDATDVGVEGPCRDR